MVSRAFIISKCGFNPKEPLPLFEHNLPKGHRWVLPSILVIDRPTAHKDATLFPNEFQSKNLCILSIIHQVYLVDHLTIFDELVLPLGVLKVVLTVGLGPLIVRENELERRVVPRVSRDTSDVD